MLKSIIQIKIWSNIVRQLSLFSNRASSFSTYVAKAICFDLFFYKCYWIVKQIHTFLHPIEIHIKVVASVCYCYKEALTLISPKWDINVEKYICC